MSFGKIGQIHKIVYASKNFRSGLNDVSIKILKPNGTLHAQGLMLEIGETGFEGVYFFNLSTNSVDPEGEYIVSIISPTESHKAKTKVTLLASIGGGGGENDVSGIEISLNITRPFVELKMSKSIALLSCDTIKTMLTVVKKIEKLEIDTNNINIDLIRPEIKLELDCKEV